MSRKRDTSYEHDRLRSIVLELVGNEELDLDLDPSKLARAVGFDTDTKEGRSAAQAIRRWVGERWEKTVRKEPGESSPRSLPGRYRVRVFTYVRSKHWGEYIKPFPRGERWITWQESERWLWDTRSTDPVKRSREDLEEFAKYLDDGAIITDATRHNVKAETNYAGGESSERKYGPAGGLTDEDYQRLAYDDMSKETLAWGVIENLLWKKGLLRSQIERARRLLADESLVELIEAVSFEKVADELVTKVTKSRRSKE